MALETVLVALGASDNPRIDQIIDNVVDIAGPTGAAVVLTHVFSDEEFEVAAKRLEFDAGSADPEDVAGRHSTVREAAERLEAADVEYTVRGGVGDKGQEIVDSANDVDADLVVVGGRRRSPTGKAVFGSTAQQVLLDSPVPVLFVRAE